MTKDKFYKLQFALIEYIKKYGEYYSKENITYIKNNFISDYDLEEDHNCLLLEAYEECGLSSGLYRDYFGAFIKHIKEDCDIKGDLLEVGCGPMPSLAKSLRKEQENGSITVIDPLVKISDYGDLNIITGDFDENMDVKKYSLMYSCLPCAVTEAMLKSSFKNDIDAYILLCGCLRGLYFNFYHYLDEIDALLYRLSLESDRSYKFINYSDMPYTIVKTYK